MHRGEGHTVTLEDGQAPPEGLPTKQYTLPDKRHAPAFSDKATEAVEKAGREHHPAEHLVGHRTKTPRLYPLTYLLLSQDKISTENRWRHPSSLMYIGMRINRLARWYPINEHTYIFTNIYIYPHRMRNDLSGGFFEIQEDLYHARTDADRIVLEKKKQKNFRIWRQIIPVLFA